MKRFQLIIEFGYEIKFLKKAFNSLLLVSINNNRIILNIILLTAIINQCKKNYRDFC
jgi:hypothetical protein